MQGPGTFPFWVALRLHAMSMKTLWEPLNKQTKGNIFHGVVPWHCQLSAEASSGPSRGFSGLWGEWIPRWEEPGDITWAFWDCATQFAILSVCISWYSFLQIKVYTFGTRARENCHYLSSIYSFNKCSLSSYHVPGTILGIWLYSIGQESIEHKNQIHHYVHLRIL